MKRITTLPFYYSKTYPPYMTLAPEAVILRDKFNDMVDNGEITFEDVPCLCGKKEFSTIATFDRYRLKQKTVICESCGLVQSMPRMTQESFDWFYSSDFYRQFYDYGAPASVESITTYYQDRYSKRRYEYITSKMKGSIADILEFGCAGGWNLYPFFKNGSRVLGFDLGPDLVAKGRTLGMDLRVGTMKDIPPGRKFDLIILAHVIEHLADPVLILRALAGYLKPKGLIYIEVPNIDRFKKFHADVQLQNAHIYYFSPATLMRYTGIAGLTPKTFMIDILGPNMGGLFYRNNKPEPVMMVDGLEFRRIRRAIRKNETKYYSKKIAASLHIFYFLRWIKRLLKS